jgi:lipoprotein-releasing system ATP-binding protein
MNNIALSLQGVTHIYKQAGRELKVLDGFNLTIGRGEMVALVGPSGSGKTTLLQIAGLLDTPTIGEVHINGESMRAAGDEKRTQCRRNNIGFIYQFHHLLPEFSALENVMLPQMIAGVGKSDAEKKASKLLSALGLTDRLSHRPAALSGGEQQRVAIARATANDPALLLADEPTGNLDPTTAEIVFDMLIHMAREKGLGMLVATHNLDLASRMDRVVRL